MARRVFFSFHYQDVIDFRANVVRNHNVTKDNNGGFFDASIWESAKKQGDIALKRLINGSLENTSTTVVLIGSETYSRRWVQYEIMKSIGSNIDVEQVRRDILKLHEQLALLPDGKEADELDMEITRLEISANLLLPDDFLAGVVSYAMGIAKSDIKEVNEEMLYNAAVAAKLGGDNPADHLHGRFTDFMRDDINRRAWIIFHQKAKEMGDGS